MTALLMIFFAMFGGGIGLPALFEIKRAGDTGIIRGRYGIYERCDNPGAFWYTGFVYSIIGVVFTAIFAIALVAAVAAMLGYFA